VGLSSVILLVFLLSIISGNRCSAQYASQTRITIYSGTHITFNDGGVIVIASQSDTLQRILRDISNGDIRHDSIIQVSGSTGILIFVNPDTKGNSGIANKAPVKKRKQQPSSDKTDIPLSSQVKHEDPQSANLTVLWSSLPPLNHENIIAILPHADFITPDHDFKFFLVEASLEISPHLFSDFLRIPPDNLPWIWFRAIKGRSPPSSPHC
jgi:hypothetical protein